MLKLFLFVCFTANVLVASIPLEKPVIEERIIGGNDTDITKVPHQVAVLLYNMPQDGGFIISPTHVVTAAQNTEEFGTNVTIRAGSSTAITGGITINVKKVHVHPKYNNKTKDYDVAVLELATPLKIDDKTMKPIKLATKEPSVGSVASVSGYGYIDDVNWEMAKVLQSANVAILDRTKCANIFKPEGVTITPRMLCAGAEGRNVFIGDSGGALVYKNEAVGIALLTVYKNLKKLPGVYTNIADPEITKFIKDAAKL